MSEHALSTSDADRKKASAQTPHTDTLQEPNPTIASPDALDGPKPSPHSLLALQTRVGNRSLMRALDAGRASAPIRRDMDDKMMDQADAAGKSGASDTVTDVVASRTVIGDQSAAKSLMTKISGYSDGVKAAEKDHSEFAGSLAVNTNTSFQVQLWATQLSETDRNLGDFQSFYVGCKTDYSRLLGMAHGFTAAKGGKPADEHVLATVVKDFKPDALKGTKDQLAQDPAFARLKDRWEDGRKDLHTTATKLTESEDTASQQLQKMLSAAYRAQGKAAAVRAAKDQAKLDTVKKDIADAVSNIMTAVSLAGKLTSAIGAFATASNDPFSGAIVPKIDDPHQGEDYIPKNIGAPERRDARQGLPSDPQVQDPHKGDEYIPRNIGDPARAAAKKDVGGMSDRADRDVGADTRKGITAAAGHLKGGASEGEFKNLTDPKAILQKLGEYAEGGKIRDLEASIGAAKEEEGLANAAADAAEMEAANKEWKNALTKLGDLVEAFVSAQKALRTRSEELAKYAKRRSPKLGAAFRFVTESDTFLAKADNAVRFGKDQQKSGKEALDQRSKISSATDPANSAGGDLYYYAPYSLREKHWYGKDTVDHRVRKTWVELPADTATAGGFANTAGSASSLEGTTGAQNVTAHALQDLESWKMDVTDLRRAVESSLHIDSPGSNVAL